jgi:hypothetical protein
MHCVAADIDADELSARFQNSFGNMDWIN